MEADKLDQLFEKLENNFDIEEPAVGHQNRFLSKLRQADSKVVEIRSQRSLWRPLLAVAASIALVMVLVIGSGNSSNSRELASISEEMATTQDFFTAAISSELKKLSAIDTPEYQDLIVDALFQIKLLEEAYIELRIDLDESGDDQRVIHAMISNFQNRINILQNVLEQINELEQLKTLNNEDSYTL